MVVLGVTGQIGSGKTAFCEFLEAEGAVIVYADSLAKELMVQDTTLKRAIIELFGEESYTADGEVNKAYLAQEAFQKGRSEELNALVHPAVARAFRERIDLERQKGTALLVKEAALLLHKGRADELDYVVWIQADLDERIKRVTGRERIDINEVIRRNERQKSLSEVATHIDEIVINDGSLDDLRKKAHHLFRKLTSG